MRAKEQVGTKYIGKIGRVKFASKLLSSMEEVRGTHEQQIVEVKKTNIDLYGKKLEDVNGMLVVDRRAARIVSKKEMENHEEMSNLEEL